MERQVRILLCNGLVTYSTFEYHTSLRVRVMCYVGMLYVTVVGRYHRVGDLQDCTNLKDVALM